jgi:hypothetical protein
MDLRRVDDGPRDAPPAGMKPTPQHRPEAVATRESMMKLLTDDEVAKVSNAESGPKLTDGDEYLDLVHLDKGVRRANRGSIDMTHLLPKKSVTPETWMKLVAHLPARPATR